MQEALDAAVAERERATRALIEARREFVDLGGSEVQADARRLAIAADSLASRVRDLRSEGDQLQGELRTLMLSGHYESKEEAAAKVEQAKSDLARLERQAAAARRLVGNTERRATSSGREADRAGDLARAAVSAGVVSRLRAGCGRGAGYSRAAVGAAQRAVR